MLTFKRNPRSSVSKPRSGEDLVLLPLEADEVIVEEKPQITRGKATAVAAVLVCAAMLAAYLFKDTVSPIKSPSLTPPLQPGEAQQAEKIPQPLELSSELALPTPKLPKLTDSSDQAIPTASDSLAGPSSVTSATPPVSDHVKEQAARPVKPAYSALWVEPEAPRRHADAEQQRKAERPSTTITPPPAKATEGVTSAQLRRTKEKLAELTALIAKEDFVTAINNAITFRDKNPDFLDSVTCPHE